MPDIGTTLEEARMRAGVDLNEVETTTKIRAKYLRAIEQEEWELLPGPTFVKSFLRTYADYLGLDGKLLVEEYKMRHEPPPEHDPAPIAPPLGREPRARLRAPAIPRGWAIAMSVVGLFAMLIVLGSINDEKPSSITATTQPTRTSRPAPPPPPKPSRVALRLIPGAEVYVCLRNAQDKLILNETLVPGSGSDTYRSARFWLTLGNNAVEVRANGKSVKVPPSANAINYELTPAGNRRLPDERNACEGA